MNKKCLLNLVLSDPLPSLPLRYPTHLPLKENCSPVSHPIAAALSFELLFVAVVAPCFDNLPTVG